MPVYLKGKRTVGDLLAGITGMLAVGALLLGDEVRVDGNDGGFCTRRVDRLDMEGNEDEGKILVLTLQKDDDGTP